MPSDWHLDPKRFSSDYGSAYGQDCETVLDCTAEKGHDSCAKRTVDCDDSGANGIGSVQESDFSYGMFPENVISFLAANADHFGSDNHGHARFCTALTTAELEIVNVLFPFL